MEPLRERERETSRKRSERGGHGGRGGIGGGTSKLALVAPDDFRALRPSPDISRRGQPGVSIRAGKACSGLSGVRAVCTRRSVCLRHHRSHDGELAARGGEIDQTKIPSRKLLNCPRGPRRGEQLVTLAGKPSHTEQGPPGSAARPSCWSPHAWTPSSLSLRTSQAPPALSVPTFPFPRQRRASACPGRSQSHLPRGACSRKQPSLPGARQPESSLCRLRWPEAGAPGAATGGRPTWESIRDDEGGDRDEVRGAWQCSPVWRCHHTAA